MLIRSYFTAKKRNVLDGELEKVVPASMAGSVKAELQCTAGVKRTIEGGSTEKKRGAYEKITPENKAKTTKYAAEKWNSSSYTPLQETAGISQSEGEHCQRVEESLL